MTQEKTPDTEQRKERSVGGEISPPQAKLIPAPSGVKEVYVNFVAFSWTQYDVRVRLAQIIPNPDEPPLPEFIAEERVAATITWPHAKALMMLLAELVKEYEKANGPIVFPKLPSV